MTNWVKFGVPRVAVVRRPNGAMLLRAQDRLAEYPPRMGDVFLGQAEKTPDRLYMASRDPSGAWRKVTYAEMGRLVRAIGQAVLDRKLDRDRPVMIVAENGVDHALMSIGCLIVGVPFTAGSAAYARPGLIFVDNGTRYAGARDALATANAEVTVAGDLPPGADVTPFAALTRTTPTAAVEAASRTVGPDTVAKILFTSGSTDMPKGVINTHRMLCSNQAMIAFQWPFLHAEAPVLCD